MASDGTVISFASTGLIAIRDGALLWQTPIDLSLLSSDDLVVDSESTVVWANHSSVEAFDVATGTSEWGVWLPDQSPTVRVAPAAPRELYVLTDGSLSLFSD